MKGSLQLNKFGSTSQYFLVIFLMIDNLILCGTINLQNRIRTANNIKTILDYQELESNEINALKATLDKIESFEEIAEYYDTHGSEVFIYTTKETIIAQIDQEDLTIYDYRVERKEKSSYKE